MISTRNILVTMMIPAVCSCAYAGLYLFGGLFIYNSIASLVIYCAMWIGVGVEYYFRKKNVFKLFVATSMGEDKKKLKNSKKIFGLEVFSSVLTSASQIALAIAVYVVNDTQIRIDLTRVIAGDMLGLFVLNTSVTLSYAIQVRHRLLEHLKTDAAVENAKTINVGLRKITLIRNALIIGTILSIIPQVLIMAMPIVHAYILQIYLMLYMVTIIQTSMAVFQPAKLQKDSNSASTTMQDITTPYSAR